MPPLMISVWDAEKRLSLATRHAQAAGHPEAGLNFAWSSPRRTEARAASD
jgi:hypothetical protein